MRNAGDLASAADVHSTLLRDGRSAAQELGLPRCAAAFSLSPEKFEERHLKLFDGMIAELRAS